MSTFETRLAELGVTLPEPTAALANYVPFVQTGALVHISGQVSMNADGWVTGKLGDDMSVEDGAAAAKLRAINGADKSVTAGNASGVNDGAAALLIASGTAAEHNGLEPMARIVGMNAAGVMPRVMGIGPVVNEVSGLTLVVLSHEDTWEITHLDINITPISINFTYKYQCPPLSRARNFRSPRCNPSSLSFSL